MRRCCDCVVRTIFEIFNPGNLHCILAMMLIFRALIGLDSEPVHALYISRFPAFMGTQLFSTSDIEESATTRQIYVTKRKEGGGPRKERYPGHYCHLQCCFVPQLLCAQVKTSVSQDCNTSQYVGENWYALVVSRRIRS
jgi:hypothetical protein